MSHMHTRIHATHTPSTRFSGTDTGLGSWQFGVNLMGSIPELPADTRWCRDKDGHVGGWDVGTAYVRRTYTPPHHVPTMVERPTLSNTPKVNQSQHPTSEPIPAHPVLTMVACPQGWTCDCVLYQGILTSSSIMRLGHQGRRQPHSHGRGVTTALGTSGHRQTWVERGKCRSKCRRRGRLHIQSLP